MNNKIIVSFLAALTVATTVAPMALYFAYPLHNAARDGDAIEVRRLLATKKFDLTAFDTSGATPLHCAVRKGHVDCVIALLDGGTQVDILDCWGSTPLLNAAFRDNVECVEILLRYGANVNAQDSAYFTPLHYAATSGHRNYVDIFLAKGANAINAKTKAGNTPVMLAEKHGHHELAKYLKEIAASLEIKEPDVEQEK
ncbi:ankyrin repeat domain-containing protein [bacterium]|nr:MAG: ankyrin repeat domain-containing protein [bacterium]